MYVEPTTMNSISLTGQTKNKFSYQTITYRSTYCQTIEGDTLVTLVDTETDLRVTVAVRRLHL